MVIESGIYRFTIGREKLLKYFSFFKSKFDKYIENNAIYTKYLDLGVKIVRLQIPSKVFLSIIEQYFACSLLDKSDCYDATIYMWEDDIESYKSNNFDNAKKMIFRYENNDIINLNLEENTLTIKDIENNNYYFAMNKFSFDKISKLGHLFVHFINSIVTTLTSTLVHSACVGIDDKGVLICARGGSGKSTLSVSCLVDNFQYISDDYLILNRQENNLYAYSIYSMISLSPQIIQKMPNLKVSFIGPNYNQKKEILNISSYKNIVKSLNVKAAVFPKIANISEPTIEKVNKGKAITQLVYSTSMQMNQEQNTEYIKLLISLVKDLDFYQINLSPNLEKNVIALKQFIKNL